MADNKTRISEIVALMLSTWDMPPDCNEGELFTYAETLYDRIAAGESKDQLYAYLSTCRPTIWTWRSRTVSKRLSIASSSSRGAQVSSCDAAHSPVSILDYDPDRAI